MERAPTSTATAEPALSATICYSRVARTNPDFVERPPLSGELDRGVLAGGQVAPASIACMQHCRAERANR